MNKLSCSTTISTTTRALMGALALAAGVASLPARAADVGVSVSIGQPGFYGRIDIGSRPPPVLIYPEPVVYAPAPYAVVQRPIYLRVPPGHAKNWGKHCARYSACGQPVYFVQDSWYQEQYVQPYYRERGGYDRGRGDDRGYRNGYEKGYDKHHDKGQGKGQGKGHGKGRDD